MEGGRIKCTFCAKCNGRRVGGGRDGIEGGGQNNWKRRSGRGIRRGRGGASRQRGGPGGRERCFQLYITVPEKALKCTDSRHRREMIRGANTTANF